MKIADKLNDKCCENGTLQNFEEVKETKAQKIKI